MNTLYSIYLFIIGMFMGSFFGVVGSRLPNNESIVKPRSHCTNCGHVLNWYELIPVFSFIIQRGKCKKCKNRLSIMYPIIEILSGLLFAVSYFKFGFSKEFIFSILIVSDLIIVLVSDLSYLIIPDEVTIFFSIAVIIFKFVLYGFREGMMSIISGILLFLLMYCIMMLGNKAFKKETLGGADVKLMFLVGLILYPPLGIFSIFLSSCLALPISLYFLVKNKDNVIPFGPFILMSLFIIYCFM